MMRCLGICLSLLLAWLAGGALAAPRYALRHALRYPSLSRHASWNASQHARRQDPATGYLPSPSYDDWYRAPSGWEATAPGTVLRFRPHAYNMTPKAIANVGDTFQVLFRSLDSQRNPTWAVTTVFIPTKPRCVVDGPTNSTNANSTGSSCVQPIVSYQLPYDTSCVDAGPSFGLQFGEPYGEMAVMLARGWWISVPDYEGPTGSYGANIVAGYITLDSVRAVLSAVATYYNMPLHRTRTALWGYSNGASATDAAVEFADDHAPELELAGAAIGGLAANVGEAGATLSGTQVAGLLVQGVIGVTSQYPDQRAWILERLNPSGPYNATEFFFAAYMSGWQSLLYYSYVDVFAYFKGGRADLETQGMIDMFVREGTLGVFGVPSTKVFVYHAVEDDMAPIKDADALVKEFCDKGANVLYHRNSWGGHNDELTNGRQRAIDFLGTVLDGTQALEVPETGCKTVELKFMQDPRKPIA